MLSNLIDSSNGGKLALKLSPHFLHARAPSKVEELRGLEPMTFPLVTLLTYLYPNLARCWRDDVTRITEMGYALTTAGCLNSQ